MIAWEEYTEEECRRQAGGREIAEGRREGYIGV